MPSVKDFETKKTKGKSEHHGAPGSASGHKKKRRRPGMTTSESQPAVEEHKESEGPMEPADDMGVPEHLAADHQRSQDAATDEAHGDSSEDHHQEKVSLDFYGSELLRSRVPKAFEVAEAVATEWVNDGRFEGLPVGHPVAQLAAQVSLRKAKDLEKKLEEKGVFTLARMGLELAKSKLRKR